MITWSPDGKLLAVAGSGGALLLDGYTLQTPSGAGPGSACNQFLLQQRWAAPGNWRHDTALSRSGNVPGRRMVQVIPEAGQSVFISPDGKLVAAVDDNAVFDSNSNSDSSKVEIHVFQVDTGKMLSEFSGITAIVWQNPVSPGNRRRFFQRGWTDFPGS